MDKDRRTLSLVVMTASIVVAITVVFAMYRAMGPSDGTYLEPIRESWTEDGVIVQPVDADERAHAPGGLLQEDVVVAVNGKSMEAWGRDLFNPAAERPDWQIGDQAVYTVLRDGQPVDIDVVMIRFPLVKALQRNWGLVLFGATSQLLALFVLLRRPEDRAAQLLFLWSYCACHIYVWSIGLTVPDLVLGQTFWPYSLVTTGVWLLYWGVAAHFSLVFPQRHPIAERYPRLIQLFYALPYLIFGIYAVITRQRSGSILEWIGGWDQGGYLVAATHLSLMVGFILWGYFLNLDSVARKKIRWVVYGTILSGGGGLILWILPPILISRPMIDANAAGLLLLPFPISLAIAILRYRLFDIDIIIKKTLVYGSVTLTLAAIYLVSVLVLQEVVRRLTGESRSSLVTVLSTLGIAALFDPLRRRIQRDIDRRFYRKRYDADHILSEFGVQMREEVDLERLSQQLLGVVKDTVQPEKTSLWLKR